MRGAAAALRRHCADFRAPPMPALPPRRRHDSMRERLLERRRRRCFRAMKRWLRRAPSPDVFATHAAAATPAMLLSLPPPRFRQPLRFQRRFSLPPRFRLYASAAAAAASARYAADTPPPALALYFRQLLRSPRRRQRRLCRFSAITKITFRHFRHISSGF